MSILDVDRRAWHSLFAAQIGWMLDAMDFLLFSFAVVPIAIEFHLSKASMGALTSVALIAGLSTALMVYGPPATVSPAARL